MVKLTQFTAEKKDLLDFLAGVTRGKKRKADGKPADKSFFNDFFLTPQQDGVKVVSTDSLYHKRKQRSFLKCDVSNVGAPIPVIDTGEIVSTVKAMSGKITLTSDGKNITIQDKNSSFSRGIPTTTDKMRSSLEKAIEWDNAHVFEGGELVFRVPQGERKFETKYEGLPREELQKAVKLIHGILGSKEMKVGFTDSSLVIKGEKKSSSNKTQVEVEAKKYTGIKFQMPRRAIKVLGFSQIIDKLPGDPDIYMRKAGDGTISIVIHVVDGSKEYTFGLGVLPEKSE